jgi:hypothetical protein
MQINIHRKNKTPQNLVRVGGIEFIPAHNIISTVCFYNQSKSHLHKKANDISFERQS